LIWFKGSLGGTSQSGGVFEILTNFDWPWAQMQWPCFWCKHCFGN